MTNLARPDFCVCETAGARVVGLLYTGVFLQRDYNTHHHRFHALL
jgi:hypothetical protein